MRVLDLFSGIGAFSLGLERAGMTTVAFCESDAYCRRVLARHWPEVPCYDDVRSLTAERLRAAGISVDVICGGFPCQDISVAGRGAGINGERSGLWSEFARLIDELRPHYALVENVAALLSRGMGDVLGDLATLGYDAEWHCIPAAAVGAPHRRDRVWIVGYPSGAAGERNAGAVLGAKAGVGGARGEDGNLPDGSGDAGSGGAARDVAYPARVQPGREEQRAERERVGACGEPVAMADAIGTRLEGRASEPRYNASECAAIERSGAVRDAWRVTAPRHRPVIRAVEQSDWWLAEPDVGRVAHGVASRVDRLRALGNALVPQIPEMIGRAIMAVPA